VRSGFEVDVVGPDAEDRDHFQIRTGGEEVGGELGVGADVDGHPGSLEPLLQLFRGGGFFGVNFDFRLAFQSFVGFGSEEDGRKIIGDCDYRHFSDPFLMAL
jgi:hypothetical protein